jgi:hypothetical protein
MNRFKLLAIAGVILLLFVGSASAVDTPVVEEDGSVNITIYDGVSSTSKTAYGTQEDGEVEPGCLTGQVWDLEAFLQDDNILSIIGGFNFKDGYNGIYTGDVFFDVDGDAQYGAVNEGTGKGNIEVKDTFGYDYVLTLNFTDYTYSVYELNEGSTTIVSVGENINQESNPWRYKSGGTQIDSGSFTYKTGLTDAQTGFTGGTHNEIGNLDLSFLPDATGSDTVNFIAHLTISCGNDNLMGAGVVHAATPTGSADGTPEPATMLLLASGVAGLAGFRRKIIKN